MNDFALITGASGGIGYYFAHELAKRKHNLILIARSEDKLQKLANELKEKYSISCNYLSIDLSQPNASEQVMSWCKDNHYEIDILINNAGYGLFGPFENQYLKDVTNMLQLNMNTLVELCHVFMPQLKSKSKAYILNVASTASYQAVPTLASYAASKAFVVLFTRGLRYELKDTNLSVSCFSPGTTSTNFMDRAGMQNLKERAEKFAMSAESVAKIGIEGMYKGKAEIIPGFVNWFSAKLTGFVPKALTEKIAASLYE
jgi:short-subunit dehydrogenase